MHYRADVQLNSQCWSGHFKLLTPPAVTEGHVLPSLIRISPICHKSPAEVWKRGMAKEERKMGYYPLNHFFQGDEWQKKTKCIFP